MKQTIRIFLNGFGAICALIGFCIFVGAGRNADLGYSMVNVIPYLMKGATMLFLGIFLANWE